MNRVLCVVALVPLLCAALGCAAQESELRCGGDFGAGLPCAAALSASGKRSAKSTATRALQWANGQLTQLTRHAGSLSQTCDDAARHMEAYKVAVGSLASYVNRTKGFMRQYGDLNVQHYLDNLRQYASQAEQVRKSVVQRRGGICDSFQRLSAEVDKFKQTFEEVKSAARVSGGAPGGEHKMVQKAERLSKDTASANAKAANTVRDAQRKLQVLEDAVTTAEEIRKDAETVFSDVSSAYEKYKVEHHKKPNKETSIDRQTRLRNERGSGAWGKTE